MMSKKYYVFTCMKCNKIGLVEINFLEFEDKCCLDSKNLKILKEFNDENEARNYIKLYNKED